MQKVHPLRSTKSAIDERARIEEKEDVKSDIVKVERHSPVSIELRNAEGKDKEKENTKAELEMVVTLCESPHR